MASTHTAGGDAVKVGQAAARQPQKPGTGPRTFDSSRRQPGSPLDAQARKANGAPPKAWQGNNPLTSRASSASPQINGNDRSRPLHAKADSQFDKHAHDRLLFLFANMTGYDATITLKSGEQYKGVFCGGSFDSAQRGSYTLKMVRRTKPAAQQVNGSVSLPEEYAGEGEDHTAYFDVQDTVDLSVNGVPMTAPKVNGASTSSFRTDTEISATSSFRERELQRWEPGPSDMSLDDMAIEEAGANGWDQFAVNEQKYGVKSDYNEEIYTTSIDRSHPQYAKRMAEAERLAREIEGSAPIDAHVAEERSQNTHTADDGDEEDKYSGVRRDITPLTKGGSGSYVPPSRRPLTSQPTVPGAPYDPAIISSQLAKPKPSSQASISSNKSKQNTQQKSEVAAGDDRDVLTPSPIPAAKISPNVTEDHVRDTAEAFKQFAGSERQRIKLAQEAKRTNAKLEQRLRFNDLKKFAENFKLKSRVPDDLVPILAKDHEKQVEIKRKADEAARVEEERSSQNKSVTPSNASPAPQTIAVTATEQSTTLPHQPRSKNQLDRFMPQPKPGMSPRQAQLFKGSARQPLQQHSMQGVPTGPAGHITPAQNAATGPMSPVSATKLNVNAKAFEFRPVASNFTPSGTTPSPQKLNSTPAQSTSASFFDEKENDDSKQSNEGDVDVLVWLRVSGLNNLTEDQKKSLLPNGSVPNAYRTAPTWTVPDERLNTSYDEAFPKHAQGPSPLQTPNGMGSSGNQHGPQQMHAPGGPGMQNARYFQHGQPGVPQGYDPRMQYAGGPGASVHSSPRFAQPQVAYNGHMGQMQGMPMQGFAGAGMQYPGMSPNMSQRHLQMPQQQVMMPAQLNAFRQFPQGGQFGGPQMGAPMMFPQGPGGALVNSLPHQGFSPMPQHAQLHLPHMPQHPMNQGFSQSPRPGPHMMHHTTSHQGFQQNQMPFMPGHQAPYGMNQRQMSAGHFPHATPRQQQAVPAQPAQHVPSPGISGPAQSQDEGK